MLDRFSAHLDHTLVEIPENKLLFDYKDLKCQCKKSLFQQAKEQVLDLSALKT
jgi:hypothetical protein